MKKIYILIAVLFAATQFSQAQYRLAKGDKQFNIAAGGSTYGSAAGFLGTIGMDFGIHKDVSIGGELSLRALLQGGYGYNYGTYSNRYDRPYSIFGVSANGNYHFNSLIGIPTKYDLYAGANVGIYFIGSPAYTYNDPYYNYTYTNPSYSGVGPGIGLQTGGRYYFTNRTAILGEIGFTNIITYGTVVYFKFGASFAF